MVRELQKELIEKILLIPVEADSEALGKEALEVIGKLKGHINDTITINDQQLTILDCVIIADSQGGVRLGNKTLKELENAIRGAGGKTSEELGQVRNIPSIPYDRAALLQFVRQHFVPQQVTALSMALIYEEVFFPVRSMSVSTQLAYARPNLTPEQVSRLERSANARPVLTLVSAPLIAASMVILLATLNLMVGPTRVPRELRADTNLENATVQPAIEERQPDLDLD